MAKANGKEVKEVKEVKDPKEVKDTKAPKTGKTETKETKEVKETKETKGTKGEMVGIPELSKEFGVEGRDLRAFLRKNGYKAPEVKSEGFGPRAKYQWAEGSKELKEVRDLIKKGLEEEK